jgi:PAS domain S-box-containing protein
LIELHKGLMDRSKGSYESRNVQSEEVFRLVIENIKDYAVILTDADGQITVWNTGIRNLLGYSEGEFIGQPLSIIFTPEDISAGVSEKQSAQTITENNYWIRRKDGSQFWANFKVVPLKNTDGNLRGFTCLLRDETSRKLAEENLERVLSGITDSFFRFDRDFRYVYVNRATTEMFGLSEADFLGKTLWELFPDADENIFHSEVKRALKEQETIVFENYYEPFDRWFENRVYPSSDGLSVFVTEITERKKIETALQQSEEKYRTLFDSIDSGFCVIELIFGDDGKAHNYTYLEINPSFEKQSGLQDAVGKTIRDFAPDHEDFWFETYTHVSLTGESVRFEHYSSGLDNWFEVYAFRLGETQTNRVAIVFNNITPRKLAEEKIIQLNERSRNILESINDAFFALDADWNFTYLNNQAEVLLKRTREEILGKNIWEEFSAAVGTTFHTQYYKAFDEQTTVTFEEFYPPLDAWFEVRAYPSATGLSVYFHNIDERRKSENSLVEAEARYRALIEATSTTVWHATADGALSFVGDVWTQVSGQTVEEILKWGWLEAIHPDDRERTIEIWQTALRDKTLYETEFRVLTTTGEYRWFAVNAVPIFNSDGNVREWIGLNTDINKRKKDEEALLERTKLATLYGDIGNALVQTENSENLLKRCAEIIVENLDVAFARIWTLNEAENILELRASAGIYTHLDGQHSRVPVGQFKIGLIAQERKPHLTNDVIYDPRIGDVEWARREKMQAFAGYPLIVEDRIVGVIAMFSRHKMSKLTLEAMESISNGISNSIERKQVEEKRQQLLTSEQEARQAAENANRLKDEFLATLSHELRTPLNAILGWSQMIQNRDLSESQMQKALQTIERSARSQNQLIDDLLDVSRIITGKLRLDVRAVELSNVIAAAVDAVRPAAEAKNIRLQTLLDPQAGPISGDPDRLQQVVWNLLSNAVKFTPKEGRVQVRLERVNSHVEIVISDTGRGIEAEFLPYVFDRFRQSDGSMTRRHGGLGLGLAIVRQLVELHGGTAMVTSAGENQGSTFTVFLPLLPVRSEPSTDELRVHPAARNDDADILEANGQELSGLCVLIVEDEADSRELLSVVLTSSGAKVVTADSAAEALEKIKSEKLDIIVSDIGMPGEDGFSLMLKVRNLPKEQNADIPAIALTAYARAEDRIKALRCGFQLHIAKPVESTELIAAVANLTGRIREIN